MNAIFASKMYKSSPNKEKIRAAIEDPVNVELVKQLREYLDDEYITEEYFGEVDKSDETAIEDADAIDDAEVSEDKVESDPKPATHSAPHFTPSSTPTIDTDDSSVSDGESSSETSESQEDLTDEVNEDVTEVVEEATNIDDAIIATSDDSAVNDIDADSLKGLLNSRSDTSGATRVSVKENELWIYYNDKINLNNVMGPVIDLLNASSYTNLDFNRLARTDNAMVFEIASTDSGNQVDPIGGEVDAE